MEEQCFFKKEVVKQKKKEGWQEVMISQKDKDKNQRQGIVLMKRKGD